jgi:exopolyphosphatase / guanosine-5'-triphosphate,3'-diphosphate pyrophosphatase
MAETFAGIDIGTNSVRLLIRDRDGNALQRDMEITRLGQGVDATGTLHPDAIARTLAVLERYHAACRSHGVTRLRAVATSAARDARNREQFFAPVRALFGQGLELLSGEAEALLSFSGATSGMPTELAPFLVFDIGGGSTEFARGVSAPSESLSLDIGSVRLTEKFQSEDSPTPGELDEARGFIGGWLERVEKVVQLSQVKTWVGVAGTVTSVAALVLGSTRYEPEKTHQFRMARTAVAAAFERLCGASLGERRGLLIHPARAEVIVMGALILDTIMERFSVDEVMVSEKDILDGVAALAARG